MKHIQSTQGIVIIGLLLTISIISTVSTFTVTPSQENTKKELHTAPQTYANLKEQYEQELLGTIDPEEYRTTYERIKKSAQLAKTKRLKDGGITGWEDLGPHNIGGRIRAVAVTGSDPDKIYIGGAAGGVWRSNDGGSSWMHLNSSHISNPISSIAINPIDSDEIIVGTGEYKGQLGTGLLMSNDDGITWRTLSIPVTIYSPKFTKVVYNPLNPKVIYASGTRVNAKLQNNLGIIIKSTDGGTTWQQLHLDSTVPIFTDIEIHPSDTSIIAIAGEGNALISTNNGQSFTSFLGVAPKIFNGVTGFPSRHEVSFCSIQDSVIYVLRNNIPILPNPPSSEFWRSDDLGATWNLEFERHGSDKNHNPLGSQGDYDQLLWVDPTDCNRVLIGGIQLWKYENSNLIRISNSYDDIGDFAGAGNSIHADQHIAVPHANYDGSSNQTVFIGNDGGLYKSDIIWNASTNSGWQSLVEGLGLTQFYGADVNYNGEIIVGGAQDNGGMVETNSSNGQKSWANVSGGDGGFSLINKKDNSVLYTSLQLGNIFRSEDGGQSFCHIASFSGNVFRYIDNTCILGPYTSISDQPSFIAPMILDPIANDTLYFGGSRLWRSANRGDSWTPLNTANLDTNNNVVNSITAIAVDPDSTNIIYIGYNDGKLQKSINFGSTWQQLNLIPTPLPHRRITSIAVSAVDNRKLAVSYAEFNSVPVYISDDGGSTWVGQSLGTQNLVHSLQWHPLSDDWLYAGTEFGVFVSENNGQLWNIDPLFSENEGPIIARISQLFWQGNDSETTPYYLVAATHGRGIWRSNQPIFGKIYVDKNFTGNETGSFHQPFNTLKEAYTKVSDGGTIVFISDGIHNELPPALVMKKEIHFELLSNKVVMK